MDTSVRTQRTYGNWRRGRRAGLYGLGPYGTAGAFGVLATAAGLLMASPTAAAVVGVVGLLALAPMAVRVNGRTGVQIIAARVLWWRGRSRRHHLYRSGLVSRVTGRHQLPGLLARSEVYEVQTGRGDPAAVVVVPQSRHYTVVLRCVPEGMDLVDQPVIDARVGRMAGWLSMLAREPMLAQAQVTVTTTPDPGSRLAAEVAKHSRDDAPALARQVLDDVVRTYPAGSAAVDTLVSLTYTPAGGRRMDHAGMCREIALRLPHLIASLTGAGAASIIPLPVRDLAAIIRAAYDPAVAVDITADPEAVPTDWSDIGPVATVEEWTHYRHDSGVSRTWCMTEAPRGAVFASTFSRLAEPDTDLLSKRVAITYRPYSVTEAARLVEADKRDARFLAGQKTRPSSRDLVDLAAAEQAAEEEAAGAGVVRFSVLVTATVATVDQLDDADATIRARAGEARLSLRPMYGGQAAGFAASLGIGVVLPTHARIPT